jgi:G2/mitotic-specific cyclin 3/4
LTVTHGDENRVAAKQATHNRHKSAGPIRVMPPAALNAPPKRTAFGDVSNTARGRAGTVATGKTALKETGESRPKSIVPATAGQVRTELKENKKPGTNEARSKASTQSKGPAPTTTKTSRTGPTTTQGSSFSQRVALGPQNSNSAGSSLSQPAVRNAVPKKTTTVYNDNKNRLSVYPDAPSPADDIAILAKKPVAAAKNPRHIKSQPVLRTEPKNVVRKPQPNIEVHLEIEEVVAESDINDNATDVAYEDAVEHQSSNAQDTAIADAMVPVERVSPRASRWELPNALRHTGAQMDIPAEFEEDAWDEEEAEQEELYEDQGYTTAHSIRSHGDNTTSSQTALFAPAVTADVRMELEMAKAYVAQHQNPEEEEDEAWDISMVAEYGDEIFEYMRELEVCLLMLATSYS